MVGIGLSDVTKRYGSVLAVDAVTLEVPSRAFVTLLGPSGSGKTTTMRMVAGLEVPSAGSIRIGDRTVSAPGTFVPTHRRELGMVFQSYAVWPHKTVMQNVAFPLQQRGVGRSDQQRRVSRILDRVGLGDLGERYPSQLSGGQQQRVALARALVAEPQVILFDEPLSNLDAQLRESMRLLLREIHDEFAITAVYVTHDQVEAMVLSDRVYIMNHGQLVQGGTPEDLYERPNSRFVAEFIGSANTLALSGVDEANGRVCLEEGIELNVGSLAACNGKATLVVRPHRISFARNGTNANVVAGTVSVAAYMGDRMRYVVRTDAGSDIALETMPGPDRHAQGDQVRLHLPPDACIVV